MVFGIDLSGPGNSADTVCVVFEELGESLALVECVPGAADRDIVRVFTAFSNNRTCHVGLDAPLSYNPGGGDRPSDKALRNQAVRTGLLPGSVMPPTLTRMVYLTLRGMAVARLIESSGGGDARVVEVHPAAAMALGGAPVAAVRSLKADPAARRVLLKWLAAEGLQGVQSQQDPSDHYVAACGCALAAWKWALGRSAWLWQAYPPYHPYDFAC